MGSGEETAAPTKQSKQSTTAQETPTTPSYPDWSSSMQAYYGGGVAPPYFATTVASPSPHPYMWGGQHPMMAPYGTPVPYPALYPPAGVYAHPSMTTNPSIVPPNVEAEGKVVDGKERTPSKKSKAGKVGEIAKAASSSGNDGGTQSADSGSDGSTDASDENNNRNGLAGGRKGSFHKMLADGANAQNVQGNSGNPVVSVAAANPNMGMDLWNPSSAVKMRPNHSQPLPSGGVMPENWGHDERELKRQKRKQSNRESARRSRLRKQAECEELQARVETLSNDNRSLREELQRLSDECEKLTSENTSYKEELTKVCGAEEVSKLEKSKMASHNHSLGDEGKS